MDGCFTRAPTCAQVAFSLLPGVPGAREQSPLPGLRPPSPGEECGFPLLFPVRPHPAERKGLRLVRAPAPPQDESTTAQLHKLSHTVSQRLSAISLNSVHSLASPNHHFSP